MLPLLTFMVGPIINLISRPHYIYKKKEYHSSCSKVSKNYSYAGQT